MTDRRELSRLYVRPQTSELVKELSQALALSEDAIIDFSVRNTYAEYIQQVLELRSLAKRTTDHDRDSDL